MKILGLTVVEPIELVKLAQWVTAWGNVPASWVPDGDVLRVESWTQAVDTEQMMQGSATFLAAVHWWSTGWPLLVLDRGGRVLMQRGDVSRLPLPAGDSFNNRTYAEKGYGGQLLPGSKLYPDIAVLDDVSRVERACAAGWRVWLGCDAVLGWMQRMIRDM